MATKTEEARERYLALVMAMDVVQEVLDEIKSVLRRFDSSGLNWRTRTRREMQALLTKSQNRLDDMRETAKEYEANMVAREWRP